MHNVKIGCSFCATVSLTRKGNKFIVNEDQIYVNYRTESENMRKNRMGLQ